MKALRITARIIVGLAFIFSGTVKAIDPLGSAYKFQDYFRAFNISFLKELSLPLAILLCTAEFIAGLSVLTGMRQKTGITVIMILMIIFTPLTFVLALTNPVSDCGCFGDAVHLTNWQTFGKNIILLALALVLYLNRKKANIAFKAVNEWITIGAATFLFVIFCVYNLRNLPVIDFLPYKTGVKIEDNMTMPENATTDKFQTTFIYEKDGIRKEFDLSNYPASDTTWKFIDQKSVLIEKGYQPPIHDFIITSKEGEDLTGKILAHNGLTVFMISKKLEEAGKNRILDGFGLGRYCINNGIDFYILTASGTEETRNYENGLQVCTTDETTLKTMIRSNPGYMLLENGIIKGKWSWANVPDNEWFGTQLKKNY